MLSILSGGNKVNSSDKAASFADMGEAIANLIDESNVNYEHSAIEEDFSISDDHQILFDFVSDLPERRYSRLKFWTLNRYFLH